MAALPFVAGIIGDATAADDALDLLGEADESLLRRAGRRGLTDEAIGSKTADLVEIARAGCRRLGPSIVSEATLASLGSPLTGAHLVAG